MQNGETGEKNKHIVDRKGDTVIKYLCWAVEGKPDFFVIWQG
jgi:hypothetical protein